MEQRCHPHEDLAGEPLQFHDRRVLLFLLPNNVLLCLTIDDVLGILEHNVNQQFFVFPYGRQRVDLREFEREVIDRNGNTFRLIPTEINNTYTLQRMRRENIFGEEGWQAQENVNPIVQNALDQFQNLIQEANDIRHIENFENTMEHATIAEIINTHRITHQNINDDYLDLIGRMRIARERLALNLPINFRERFNVLTENVINNLENVRQGEFNMLEGMRNNIIEERIERALQTNVNNLIVQIRREYEDYLHRERHRLLARLQVLREMFQGEHFVENVEDLVEQYERRLALTNEAFEREFPNRNQNVLQAIAEFDERINREREELDNIEQQILE